MQSEQAAFRGLVTPSITQIRYGHPVTSPARTIGISIPIPEPDGRHLQQKRESYGDPQARRIPAHITLLGPTEVTDSSYAALLDHARTVASARPPFSVVLRGTGSFRPVSDVVYIQVAQGVADCEQLEVALRSGPVERETEFYYHPHVTVAHNVETGALDRAFEELSEFSAEFDVESIHVYELGDDEVWRPVHELPLGG